jgi:uncharacterized protein (TIGR02246 family)
MKKRLLVLALGLAAAALWAGVSGVNVYAQDAGNDEAERASIAGVLEAYVTAFEAKDLDGVMAMFAEGDNTVMMGTGQDEVWAGTESIRAAHSAFFEVIDKETSERKVVASDVSGDLAWLAGYTVSTQATENGDETFQLNLSIVLKKAEAGWRIVSLHFSRQFAPGMD